MSEHTNRDEWISAYLDGALDAAGMAEFERAMAQDDALAAEVERLLGNDDLLRAAFDGPMQNGIDDALLERMGLADPAPSAEVIALPVSGEQSIAANDNQPIWRRWRLPAAGAMAAAIALAITLGLPGSGGMPFSAALDATPSGQLAMLDDGAELMPVLTFVAGDGRFCREFSLGTGSQGGKGIACRSGAGAWQVEALEGGATRLTDSGQIVLAAGAESTALDAAYDRLAATDPLQSAREEALIAADWNVDE
jgi:hypothetical protein